MDILTKINVDGVDYNIAPVASENQLGLVMIGSGLTMAENGSVCPYLGSGLRFGENDDRKLTLRLGTGLIINPDGGNNGELMLDLDYLRSFISNFLEYGCDGTTTTSTSTTTTTTSTPIVDDTTTTTTTTTSAP